MKYVIAVLRPVWETLRRLWDASRRGPVMGETQRFLLLSIIIGIFAGLIVVCFHIAIEFLSWNTIHASRGHGWIGIVLWPAAGAGIAYMLVAFLFPTARGSGINYTKAALYVSDGYIPARSVFGKFLVSTISIGTGNPMGPEDPALQMGAGVASYLGRLFKLTREKIRLIAPIGAAAGIGAAFNTPIAAVLLVMEEVVSSWNAGVLGSIVLSAVSAVVVSRHFLGDAPLFRVPAFTLASYSELLVYAAIGVVGGFLSAWFTRYVGKLRQKIVNLRTQRKYLLPMAAGLLVGISGIWLPEALGSGYSTIDSALHDRFTWQILLLLGAVKILTTSLCFSAGTPGGMFAPTLFIGAMIGGGMGALAHQYWPLPTSSVGPYVLVGMGTFFAGLFRAPMTSVFMVFEVSATYVIILPVMISNTIAYLISRHLEPEALLHVAAHQDGFDLPSVEEQREVPILSVEDAMKAGGARLLNAEVTVNQALQAMDESSLNCALVASGWGNWSWVQRSDLQKAEISGSGEKELLKVLSPRTVIRLYPDLSLDSALRLLGPYPILPVTSRANPNRLLGTLTLEDIHKAYGIFQTPG